ncbi:F-box and JmjC domain-containing protein [Piedraia hortae CBS 480.64]|uniref:F-box and JmjC domain-containing protein n=1 Tax=Piedraia hortae CBS 480.64 TaxID=1314780 RepID=A0A6A7BUP5_9PEZI|nr:F-box and JmjC domain-containing protein [Piedraia hortae CBS 480.64]
MDGTRPTKRARLELQKHPLRVRPGGNALTASVNLKDACGLFALLPDEVLANLLELQSAADLLRLGSTCRALHAFSRDDELWRALFVQKSPELFSWRGTWRATYLGLAEEPRVDCSNLFSDVLHRPFFCATVPLLPFTQGIPVHNRISRLKDLSVEEYQSSWFSKPFILTDTVKNWPIYKSWSLSSLQERYADTRFRAEAVDWPLKTYIEYMSNNSDESPLYLFDRSFVEKMHLSESDYEPPACFGTDLFSVLGVQRPDYRWLIIGPGRSGSTFHKDPNGTSAWNAVIRGSKYWVMFPSSSPPPGIYVSADKTEVTSPLSIAEWLLGFHTEARLSPGCVEGICNEGEVLHVPSGWYHLVLNLESSIAITQNFVSQPRLAAVLHFLRNQKQNISGFRDDIDDIYELFISKLKHHHPEALEQALETLESGNRPWKKVTENEETFTFGFSS